MVKEDGRAVVLTADRRNAQGAVRSVLALWYIQAVRTINAGGLDAAVITLRRTPRDPEQCPPQNPST